MLKQLCRELLEDSPRNNFVKLHRRLMTTLHPNELAAKAPANKVLNDLLDSPSLPQLFAFAVSRHEGDLLLAGERARFGSALESLRAAEWREFRWGDSASTLRAPAKTQVVLCLLPVTGQHWAQVAALKRELGGRLLLLTELLLPFTRLTFLQSRLGYFMKELPQILPFYLGEKLFGPLDRLDALCPLAQKSVIEFGPFDGCQTAGLVKLGARAITCIEARAENVTKTCTAADVFGWPQVRVVMDDFHNADGAKYGRHDLAFAHGVYYHAVAPLVFLENLRSLSDAVFLGGFCATDGNPAGSWSELAHEGRSYRVKEYRECDTFTAGVNECAYFFHGEDLMRFFTERGDRVEVISDEPMQVPAGRFLRFLARR